ncbi:hypothetical protein JTB14_004973 [Gonioctena quinquepunctata]|nr:hypothetical protein JTB14_004973 [Gonioctena quinquepunctata]
MNRQNTGAVPRGDFSYLPSHQANIPNPWRGFWNDTTTPEESLNFSRDGVARNDQHKFGEHTYDNDVGVAVGHPGYPIALKTHRWNVKFNGQEEAAAFLERLEEISETENIPKHRLLTALPELFYGKGTLWYRATKFLEYWETFKETFRMEFYPVHYQEDLELEISRRIQRCSESAIDYIIDLQTLIRRYGGLTRNKKPFSI